MVANTDTTRLSLVGRIAPLAENAIELSLKRNGALREIGMVERLVRALQLFKNNQLGEVQMYTSEPDNKLALSKRTLELRAAFREKINRLGEEKVEELFADPKNLPTRIRKQILGDRYDRCNRWPLRKLVTYSEERIVDGTGIGKVSLPFLVKALAKEGLSLGMSDDEVNDCFGPEKVRTVIQLTEWGGKKIRTGVEIVIEASDGKTYRTTTHANGAFFELPPGTCKIVAPKLHSPCSLDGYEHIWLETRDQYTTHVFVIADTQKGDAQ